MLCTLQRYSVKAYSLPFPVQALGAASSQLLRWPQRRATRLPARTPGTANSLVADAPFIPDLQRAHGTQAGLAAAPAELQLLRGNQRAR